MYTCIYTHMYTHMHVGLYARVHAFVHVCICIYILTNSHYKLSSSLDEALKKSPGGQVTMNIEHSRTISRLDISFEHHLHTSGPNSWLRLATYLRDAVLSYKPLESRKGEPRQPKKAH